MAERKQVENIVTLASEIVAEKPVTVFSMMITQMKAETEIMKSTIRLDFPVIIFHLSYLVESALS
jgi:hypothetical protein